MGIFETRSTVLIHRDVRNGEFDLNQAGNDLAPAAALAHGMLTSERPAAHSSGRSRDMS